MSKELFNNGWRYVYKSIERKIQTAVPVQIHLPHDAAISLDCDKNAGGSYNKGYYPDSHVLYAKKFFCDIEEKENILTLQFDGVYSRAKVYVNGAFAGQCFDGYSRFYVELNPYLIYGKENEIVVEAFSDNDSRWYTGTGIYRDVYLLRQRLIHYQIDSVKIKTISVDSKMAILDVNRIIRNRDYQKHVIESVIIITGQDGKKYIDKRLVTVQGQEIAEIS